VVAQAESPTEACEAEVVRLAGGRSAALAVEQARSDWVPGERALDVPDRDDYWAALRVDGHCVSAAPLDDSAARDSRQGDYWADSSRDDCSAV